MTRTILPLFCALLALPALHAQQVYPFAHHGKWGVVDEKGKVTMRPALDTIGFFTPYGSTLQQPLAVANKGGKAGLITPAGAWVLKPVAEQISYDLIQKQPLRWATVGGKYGLLDVGGKKVKWLTKCVFDEVGYFEQGKIPLVRVRQGSGWGVLNAAGKLIVPCTNEAVEIFPGSEEGMHIRITNKDQVTRIADDGTPLVEASEDDLQFVEEIWEGTVMEAPGYSAPVEYRTRVATAGNGLTEVLLESRKGQTDWQVLKRVPVPAGCEVAHVEHQSQKIFYISVTRAGKFGFLGDTGSFVTEPIYDSISWIKHPESHYAPIALLHFGDRVGAANSDGRQILSTAFTKISTWNDWLIVHTPNGYQGLAKPSGEVYLPAGWKE